MPTNYWPFPTDASSFVLWLMIPTSWSTVLSILLERWQWFQVLEPVKKHTFIVVAFAFLSVAAPLLGMAYGKVPAPVMPVDWVTFLLNSLLMGLWSYNSSQFAHNVDVTLMASKVKAQLTLDNPAR